MQRGMETNINATLYGDQYICNVLWRPVYMQRGMETSIYATLYRDQYATWYGKEYI